MHILTGDDAHLVSLCRLCESTKMAISLERSCKLHVPNALIQRNTPASLFSSWESDGRWCIHPCRVFISCFCFAAAGDPGEVSQTGPNGAMGRAGQWGSRAGQRHRLWRWRWVSSIGRWPEPKLWVAENLFTCSFTAPSFSLCLQAVVRFTVFTFCLCT